MWQSIRLSIAGILFAALLPMTVWGYDVAEYPGDRGYLPSAGSTGGSHFSGSLRLKTGMTGDGYYVRAWLDGVRPGDVRVYLQRNRLVLQVAQGGQYEQHNPNVYRSSQWQMRFRRQLRLPYDADGARMTTSMKNGIMEIYIPRKRQHLPGDPGIPQ